MTNDFEVDCSNCVKDKSGCCKSCIVEHESNVFSALNAKEIDYLIEGKKQIKFRAGETIIKQNTSSTTVICINEGLAKIYVESDAGKNVIVRIAKKGDFISGGGLFNGSVHHFSTSALTEVKCCIINSAKLTSLFHENSDFAVTLLRKHTTQNNYLLQKLVNHTQKYMPGRVADTLLYLKNEIFNDSTFEIPLTRNELAEMSNMTKESFVRILQQFKESQVIKTKGHSITILDENSLLDISKNG